MKWIKKGLIFEPPNGLEWMVTHSAIPFAQKIRDDIFRVYFCGRDDKGRSQIGYFEIDLHRPIEVLSISEKPVIRIGSLGTFDDNGVTSSWVVSHNNRQYQYYTGWNLGITVPFYFYIGLAVSEDEGETFHKVSAGPILERNDLDPFLTASPCVFIENNVWRMWYVSGTKWEIDDGKPKHYYHIKYAESKNGIDWQRTGVVCIDFKSGDEYAIARPTVLKENGIYKMWYSYRGKTYRIGYAESNDGLKWERKDESVGIDVSESGWDSEMIEYAFVFDHHDQRYMLYNGNDYGRTGVGLAVLGK